MKPRQKLSCSQEIASTLNITCSATLALLEQYQENISVAGIKKLGGQGYSSIVYAVQDVGHKLLHSTHLIFVGEFDAVPVILVKETALRNHTTIKTKETLVPGILFIITDVKNNRTRFGPDKMFDTETNRIDEPFDR